MNVSEFVLRKVVPEDVELLFDWANDDEVRENAIAVDKISLEAHKLWFNQKLNSADCGFFILEKASQPVAQIRFDYNKIEKAWEMDYSVAKKHRGMGLGKIVVKEGIRSLGCYPLIAYVKLNNIRSQRIFNSLGFSDAGLCTINNNILIKFHKELAP